MRAFAKAVAVLATLCVGTGLALVQAYHVEPVKALWSGWTRTIPGQDTVSQILTCNFDELDSASGAYCELFVGAKGGGGAYHLTVLTNPGGSQIASANAAGGVDHKWVRFNLSVLRPDSVVKGKKLTFKFTRSGGDSVQYYYDQDPYKYGWMLSQTAYDLACRVYGRMNPISDVWRACVNHGLDPWPDSGGTVALEMADSIGVKWLRDDFWCMGNWEVNSGAAQLIYSRYLDRGFGMVGILCYGSDDSTRSSGPPGAGHWGSYPPRNLYADCHDTTNWWARYCWGIMSSLDSVKYWEVWPEANTVWFLRNPSILYYQDGGNTSGDSIDTQRERCSLYVRMCQVAESVAKGLGLGQKVVGGSTYRLLDRGADALTGDTIVYAGVDWLWNVFDLAEHRYGGVENCFDIVSTHPYMHYAPWHVDFWEDRFQDNLDTTRWVMRQAGHPGMELWATEYGWPRWGLDSAHTPETDTLTQADNVSKFYTSAIARQADPRGGYDRVIHYDLTGRAGGGVADQGFGLLDTSSSQRRLPHGWAFTQESVLTGKRLNGRVMTGDTLTNTLVRMYEFEDPASLKKTWVCWMNGGEQGGIMVELPVRSDTTHAESLAYNSTPPSNDKAAAATGWLPCTLTTRPVFVAEPDNRSISRPELVVDSFWTVPGRPKTNYPVTFYARIKNRDTQRPTPQGCPTLVQLRWNEYAVDSMCADTALGPGETMTESLHRSAPIWMHGDGLLAADVNPGMRYVEREGTDDNQAYLRLYVPCGPSGGLDVFVPPGGKTGAALLPMRLVSHSWESDSTGQTPADSARVIFAFWGQRDSVVHATDTTAWFQFCPDTTLVFPRGCGKYKVYAQFRDSGENDSPVYPDSTNPIVVFDTVPATGSIVINGGARFAPSSTCTLRLAAYDSASGVGWMRFTNRPRANLVKNGGFAATYGSWSFTGTGCGYDTSLQMAKLSAGPSQAKVTQFVPAESISARSGDSGVLEASILAHVPDGDAAGEASFWYWSTRQDTSLHDTLWALVDSASYSGDLLSLTGRYNLSKRFLLTTPAPESGWVWRGGMVRVQAHGLNNGVGSVWTDDVAINAFQPQPGYAWWGTYDTLAQWDIGSGAGQHVVRALYLDSSGTENAVPFADTIILDPTSPVVHVSLPRSGQHVNHTVEVTGWAYDSVEVAGDSWFKVRTLSYRHVDSTNWLPVNPDSVSNQPVYPDSTSIFGFARHLGYWSTDSLPYGNYYLMLTAGDSAGHVSSCTTWVVVARDTGGGMRGGPEGGGSGMGEGSLFVGSSTGCVLHLSDDLDSLDCFQVTDSGSQAYVTAILEVGDDSLLVLDARGKRVHKLHKGGQHRRRLVSGLSLPMGLTKDDNGNFWLVDKGIHRIGKFRSNGTLVFTRGGLGTDSLHFHSPEGIAVKGSLVYVADTKNDRIAVWDTSGHYQATITGDFENPTAVMVSDSGAIYLTDNNDGKLKGITPLGGNIVAIGASDSSKLRGLVPSQNGHSMFSIATQPNKVYKLRIQNDESMPGGQQSAGKVNLPKSLSLAQPFPNPARTRLNIAYALPRQARVELKLYDVAGKLVTTLANGDQKPGYYNLTWNRQDSKGRSVACGVYFCTLSADDKRFSRKVVLTE